MKKGFALILAAILLMTCAVAPAEKADDQRLIDMAWDAVCRSADLYSEKEVVETIVGVDKVEELMLKAANAWKQAGSLHRAVVITVPQSALDLYAEPVLTAVNAPEAMIRHFDQFAPRMATSYAGLMNSGEGIEWVAATSAMMYEDVCILEGVPAGYTFVLLDTGDPDNPLGFVCFYVKEDGAAIIRAFFVKSARTYEYFPGIDEDFDEFLRIRLSWASIVTPLPGQDTRFGIHYAVYEF